MPCRPLPGLDTGVFLRSVPTYVTDTNQAPTSLNRRIQEPEVGDNEGGGGEFVGQEIMVDGSLDAVCLLHLSRKRNPT